MAGSTTVQIRSLALVGPGGSGKTSLADALLFKTGATPRHGTVAESSSFSDYTPEERDVRHSLTAKILGFSHQGHRFHLLDTPGYPDFAGEAYAALAAVDAIVLVLDAAGSVPAHVRRLYQTARAAHLPVFVLVNRLDGEQADLDAALEHATTLLGSECRLVAVPDQVGPGVGQVTLLLDADADGRRAALVEALVETDERAMERYLESGEVAPGELRELYRKAVHAGACVPVLCCSVAKDVGVQQLLDHLTEFAPSPADGPGRPGRRGDEEVRLRPGEAGTCAQVWKTVADPYVGRLSYLRVWSGQLSADTPLPLVRTGRAEKLANLLHVNGKETTPATTAVAGEILAVAKVEHLETGDCLCDSAHPVTLAPVPAPLPTVSLAIEPKARNDEQKLAEALKKLASEDLTFKVLRDPATKELVVSGITNLHLETMMRRLKERFHVEVASRVPRIPLKETVAGRADGHYRHKKQTGGAGQFGEVYLRIEPNERGKGFEFVDDVVGGSIPKNFIPAVEKGVHGAMEHGVFAGYPVVDVRVSVYDGKFHAVDSNETSFRIAGARAFRDAFLKARPCLLEPIVDLEVEVPATAMGDITGDLNSRRGRIQGMDSVGSLQIIKAQVPLKEILNYSTSLRSMTAGEGSYSFTFSHYDIVPAKVAEEIRAGFQLKDED